jgi:hypothetical protein
VVLDPGPSQTADLYTYAHCMKGHPGGVTVLAINAGASAAVMALPSAAERFMLTADELQSRSVRLNGTILATAPDGSVPRPAGQAQSAGPMSLPPTSITFLTFPGAANVACR